jgi:tetratricopeptide (TPR) repeat protein
MLTALITLSFVAVALSADLAMAQRFEWPERAENLKVLPEDLPPENLRAVMTGFSRALGVRCSHCHVGEEGQPLSTFDFASDENPKKDVARAMLEMLGDINSRLKTIDRSGAEPVNMWCHTCHRGVARPQTLDEALLETYAIDGSDAMMKRYTRLRMQFYGRATYDFGEASLNNLGYSLLAREDVEAAIAVFRENVRHFPESSNAYDSLAEAFLTGGQKDSARFYYEKVLELDPRNRNVKESLKDLRDE